MDFNFFKKAMAQFTSEIAQKQTALEQAKQVRNDILNKPLPRADFAEKICQWIDSGKNEKFINDLKFKTEFLIRDPMANVANQHSFNVLGGYGSKDGTASFHAVNFVFGKLCKDAVRKAIMSPSFEYDDSNIGLPSSERDSALGKVDKTIAGLEKDLQKLIDEANSAGMRV
jgi:hypothetical protein